MTDQDIIDLGIASGLVDKSNGKLIIDFTVLPDPDLYRFARLIEELTIVEASERLRKQYYTLKDQ